MILSYSKRWILCWVLFFIGLLTLVAGLFSLAVDIRQGAGLSLIASGLMVPSSWWLRRASRRKAVPRMPLVSLIGGVGLVSGAVLLPWSNLLVSNDSNHYVDDRADESETPSESSPASPSRSSNPSVRETQSTAETTVVTDPSINVRTEYVTEPPATVTEVETLMPPTVTVTSQLPLEPVPNQSVNPGLPQESPYNSGASDQPGQITSPAETMEPSQGTESNAESSELGRTPSQSTNEVEPDAQEYAVPGREPVEDPEGDRNSTTSAVPASPTPESLE